MEQDQPGISEAFAAGVDNLQATAVGAQYGLQNLAAGTQMGAGRLISDLGRIMPPIAPPVMHPYMAVRHGMVGHEMTFLGSLAGSLGLRTAEGTTQYEYQELSGRDLGQRVGSAVGLGAVYGGSSAFSLAASGPLISGAYQWGRAAGRSYVGAMGTFGSRAAGVAGGLAATIPAFAALAGIDAYAGAVAGDVRDRQDVMNFLEASSFRYATGSGSDIDTRFGAGFNRQARAKIAQGVKNIDLQDSFYSMEDLKGVVESGSDLGLFNGARSADEFNTKFKDLTDTLKTVVKTLHTSLADGMKVIKELKDQGFGDTASMKQAIMAADVLGTASGKTASEMLSIGRQGAEMVRGTGINMTTGSTMMQQSSSMIDILGATGGLSKELIRQAGGSGQLAAQMMASDINFIRSDYGRGVMIAGTSASGELDLAATQKIMSGDLSLNQIMGMGMRNLPNAQAYIRQVTHRNENVRQISEQFGDMGLRMFAMGGRISNAKTMAGQLGISVEESLRFQMITEGKSESEVEADISMLKNADKFRDEQANAFRAQANKTVTELVGERADFAGRLSDRFKKAFVAPVAGAISDTIDKVAQKVEDATVSIRETLDEKLTGVKRIRTTAISDSRADELLLKGVDVGKKSDAYGSLNDLYRKDIWSDQDRKIFAESAEYARLDSKYGERAISGQALNSRDVQAYSKALVGKSWERLDRTERMYVEEQAERTGMTKIKEEIDHRQLKSEQAIKGQDLDSLQNAVKSRDDAKEELASARGKVITQLSKSNYFYGRQFREMIETEAGSEGFDKLITAKSEVDTLSAAIAKKKASGETVTQKELDELKNKQGILTGLKGETIGRLNRQGYVGRVVAKDFAKNFDALDVSGMAGRISKAKETLGKTQDAAELIDMAGEAKNYLRSLDTSKLKGGLFGDTEKSKFEKGIAELENILDPGTTGGEISNLKEFTKLAQKSGNTALTGLLSQASKIEQKGNITNFDEIRKTLHLDASYTNASLEKAFGKDGLDSKEFLRHAGVKAFSLRMGTTKASGGAEDEELQKKEKETIKDLVDTQSKIASVANQLEALASNLEKRVGFR